MSWIRIAIRKDLADSVLGFRCRSSPSLKALEALPHQPGPVHRAFRRDYPKEIKSIASEFSKSAVVARIDSSRFRQGVNLAHVEEKLAEEVLWAFIEIALIRQEQNQLQRIQDDQDSYRSAAKRLPKGTSIRSFVSEEADWLRGHFDNAKSSVVHQMSNPPASRIAECLDILVLHLLAILLHVTNVTRTHALKEILPGILDSSFKCFPRLAPQKGADNPWKRYKDATASTASKEDYVLRLRLLLFGGDERFSTELFRPHKTLRTVSRRVS